MKYSECLKLQCNQNYYKKSHKYSQVNPYSNFNFKVKIFNYQKSQLESFLKISKKKSSLLWQQNWSDRSFRHYYLTLTYSFNILPTLACKVTTFGSQSRIRQVPYVSEKITVVIKSSLSSPLLITFWQNYFCTWSKYILFLKVSKTSHYGD